MLCCDFPLSFQHNPQRKWQIASVSGPILDPIDIRLDIQRVPVQKLATLDGDEPSPIICQRLEAARAIQQTRFVPLRKPNILVNGDMGPSEVQKFCRLDKEELVMICMAVERIGLACESIINVMSKVSPSTFREDYLSGFLSLMSIAIISR